MNTRIISDIIDPRQRNTLSMGLFVIFAPSSVWAHVGFHAETAGLALVAVTVALIAQGLWARRRRQEPRP